MMISGDTEVAVPESRDHGDMHSSEAGRPFEAQGNPALGEPDSPAEA
jgi:hypothetical protein